jgi:hypothetical protein
MFYLMHPVMDAETVGWGRVPPSLSLSAFFLFFLLIPLVSREFLAVGGLEPHPPHRQIRPWLHSHQ